MSVGYGNSLVLRVAEDAYRGDALVAVLVDGVQVGGPQAVTARRAAGEWQDITLTGDFGDDPRRVEVRFLNDAWGGTADADRNLYVDHLILGGRTYEGEAASNAAGPMLGDAAALYSAGTLTFDTGVPPAAPVRSLTIRVAEDAYQGDALVAVLVDGVQVGGPQAVTARHGAGEWQDITFTGAFAPDPRRVEVRFLNDAWGGTAGADRNLYVDHLVLDGRTYRGAAASNGAGATVDGAAALMAEGGLVFDTSAPPPLRSLTIRVAEDAYRGDALVAVLVDGVQVGGPQAVTARRAAGEWQDITLTGDFGDDPRRVEVRFLNDAWGGTADADRNLYVDHLILGGRTYEGEAASNAAGPMLGDAAALYSAGTLTFATGVPPAASMPVLTPAPPPGGTGPGLSLLGVNLAGADFAAGALPGRLGTDYTYPTAQEIDYYASKNLNVIRLPFLWERLQPVQGGPLSAAELAQIDAVVSAATAKGMKVILDPHDYGAGYGHLIGSPETPDSAFADFWGKLAGHFSANPNLIFGLMNEPYAQSATQWLGSANAAIAAIRAAGATSQEILVPGSYWDGAHSWVSSDNDTVIGTGIVDPAGNYAFEVHQYLDADSSGTQAGVASPTVGVERLTAITQWATQTNSRLFLGEFGVASDPTSLQALDSMLAYMDRHAVWQGATYWAAGPWWGDYMFSIEPTGLGTAQVTDRPQMDVLEKYAP
ncbi:Cellulase [Methylobacterium sp. 4-46]|uniref:carbohydrate-binding domain-containing protein n=1 Tax=unclassified Methylobacterium TaxID=2615210 RepID=UPI000152E038|nr:MULTISPECIES: carbohydrate-binding domain-containing protein [Methylobacterium]ACA15596.1 Cellulase [Methylobacterium sp. 4-46]WFT81308.1 carbohydrate-binding domain-containing protein [Methylobacterium nodulans]